MGKGVEGSRYNRPLPPLPNQQQHQGIGGPPDRQPPPEPGQQVNSLLQQVNKLERDALFDQHVHGRLAPGMFN